MTVTFIWERYKQKLAINDDLKYLIYYKGCFCPPHIGHFETAARYLRYPNVRMIIHQIGNQRHNVPTNVNRSIWKKYIRELLPMERIHLAQYDDTTKDYPYNHSWLEQTDVIVIIRGDEAEDPQIKERNDRSHWSFLIYHCHKKSIDVIFDYSLRDTQKISATTFINKLIRYKNRRLDVEDLYQYMPKRLSKTSKDQIIELLTKFYLH